MAAVKNTRVTLTFETDRPLLDGRCGSASSGCRSSATGFATARASRWPPTPTTRSSIACSDREVEISPVHPVTVRGDEAPEVRFVMPGRDVSASPIEEVTVVVEARDDFGIEAIELLYSVNAGDWQSVLARRLRRTRRAGTAIDAGTVLVEHVFSLESMGNVIRAVRGGGERGRAGTGACGGGRRDGGGTDDTRAIWSAITCACAITTA